MSNPLFNEKRMQEDRAGWAAAPAGSSTLPPPQGPAVSTPIDDGPTSPWVKETMTVNGTVTASATLFVLLLVAAAFGWIASTGPTDLVTGEETYQFPAIATIGIVVGFVAVIVAYFKPMWAKFLGPVYSICYGFAVGAISHAYESMYSGIVLQAAGATVAVTAAMLVLYRTRIIKVTDRFRRIVVGATLGIMALYLVSFLVNIFGGNVTFLNSPSLLGIGFSVLVCGIAAMNLALDFDLIERGVQQGFPKAYEWVAALGLVVTIVWLYLEILRLLAKLQER